MQYYVIFMNCLSVLGFIVLTVSIYLMVFVPCRLNFTTRFGMLGHAITSGICQISLTLGTVPVFLLPCPSGYPNGILTYMGMTTKNQAILQIILLLVVGWFVTYLSIIRVFAFTLNITSKWKNRLLILFFGYLIVHIFLFLYLSVNAVEFGKEGRELCIKKFNSIPPPEIFLDRTVFFVLEKDIFLILLMCDILVAVLTIGGISIVAWIMLLYHLKAQARSTTSNKFMRFQKNFTLAILFLSMSHSFGLFVPALMCLASVAFSTPIPIISHYIFLSLGIYPLMGDSVILIATPPYKARLTKMLMAVTNFFKTTSGSKTNVIYAV
ncbi:unnamed protein product [Auanema sp. JU1783]|nr:unnamed protein product [Auanema sp. JU1783]